MPQLKDEIDEIKKNRLRENLTFREKLISASRFYDSFLAERNLLDDFHNKSMLKYTYDDKVRKI